MYRPYGEVRRPERDRCNRCVNDDERDWYVPLIIDESDGRAWGYTSVPLEACEKFYGLSEAEPGGWFWNPAVSWWDRASDPPP